MASRDADVGAVWEGVTIVSTGARPRVRQACPPKLAASSGAKAGAVGGQVLLQRSALPQA
jgi:hypothetical protein